MALNFQQRNPASMSRVLLIALLIVSVVMMVVYSREGEDGALHSMQASVSGVLSPVGMAGAALSAGTDSLGSAFSDATADESTLSGLREYNEQLISEHAQLEEYKQENERLQSLLNLKDKYNLSGTGARVIGRSTQAWSQTVTIDKGTSSGVDSGLTVMGTSGVVGQVVSATSTNATVRLLTDPQSGAAAMVQRSRAEGIVRGSLSGILYLEDFDADADIQAGDVIITSGLGGSYTSGLIIGTVVSIEDTQGDSSRRAVISANSEVSALEEVFVVSAAGSDAASSSSSSADEEATVVNTAASISTADENATSTSDEDLVQDGEGDDEQ